MINQHTPGPVRADPSTPHLVTPAGGVLCAVAIAQTNQASLPVTAQYLEAEANAKLLAAAYNAFDQAARKLGVDAIELAEKFPLESTIEFLCSHNPDSRMGDDEASRDLLHDWFGIQKHLLPDNNPHKPTT